MTGGRTLVAYKRVRLRGGRWRLHALGCLHAMFHGETVELPEDRAAIPAEYEPCRTCLR